MTVKELAEKQEAVHRAYDDLKAADKNFEALYKLLEQMAKPGSDKVKLEKLQEDAMNQLGHIAQRVNAGQKIIFEYQYHLSDIMQASKIAWPPKCIENT